MALYCRVPLPRFGRERCRTPLAPDKSSAKACQLEASALSSSWSASSENPDMSTLPLPSLGHRSPKADIVLSSATSIVRRSRARDEAKALPLSLPVRRCVAHDRNKEIGRLRSSLYECVSAEQEATVAVRGQPFEVPHTLIDGVPIFSEVVWELALVMDRLPETLVLAAGTRARLKAPR